MRLYTATSERRRLVSFWVGFLCVIVVITGRLVWLQVFTGQLLQVRANEQWYRDLPLQAKRGDIYDINGNIMAQSTLTYSIYLRPVAVSAADKESTAQTLSSILSLDYSAVLRKVESRTVSEWLIKMQVEKETAMNLVSKNLDGVYLSQTYKRTYPYGSVAGQVLGLVSIDSRGQEGIEAYYDDILTGTDGKIATESDLRGIKVENGKEYYVPSVAGTDLTLNVDSYIQNVLQSTIERARLTHKAKSVSALIMDIETGGIVASGASPYYDLNEQPRDDPAALLSQIKNLPIINVLEPGSTFKIITLAAAIEEGVVDIERDRFDCGGSRTIAGERIRCWRSIGHGHQTLAEGVQNSCNCVFMELAMRVGIDKYYEYLQKFGLGEKSGVDFFGEPSGLLLDKKWVRIVDLARIGFGQAIAISPIQFLSAVIAIIGDGNLRTPQFVNNTTATNIKRRIVSQSTSDTVRKLLYGVVTNGSGKKAGVSGYQIGGKTGTAQKYKDGIIDQGHYISSFLGFISVGNRPKYACYLYVDEPSTGVYYGSIVAAHYVGEIFFAIAKYKNLAYDYDYKMEPIMDWGTGQMQYYETRYVFVPDIAGNSIVDAVAKLSAAGLFVEIDGDGEKSTGSFPTKGTMLKIGEPVVIFTQ
jgi:stage V sporulation protein D (sporulation-specific penicillin-binding protein)